MLRQVEEHCTNLSSPEDQRRSRFFARTTKCGHSIHAEANLNAGALPHVRGKISAASSTTFQRQAKAKTSGEDVNPVVNVQKAQDLEHSSPSPWGQRKREQSFRKVRASALFQLPERNMHKGKRKRFLTPPTCGHINKGYCKEDGTK